ncbi:uncharacterized protein LOC125341773 [Perognathus longimembris pacificus]|uniref:uncharacterized protein LOC125341773 n=1 Tax=Perognathus longimembris pacificus TaxID=214514 RepID=UPI0020193094|nr:uncharacterized protein LOC125341773 [Perognathus longimembris pacificus]
MPADCAASGRPAAGRTRRVAPPGSRERSNAAGAERKRQPRRAAHRARRRAEPAARERAAGRRKTRTGAAERGGGGGGGPGGARGCGDPGSAPACGLGGALDRLRRPPSRTPRLRAALGGRQSAEVRCPPPAAWMGGCGEGGAGDWGRGRGRSLRAGMSRLPETSRPDTSYAQSGGSWGPRATASPKVFPTPTARCAEGNKPGAQRSLRGTRRLRRERTGRPRRGCGGTP